MNPLSTETGRKYLAARAAAEPWRIEGCLRDDFDGCVVIPALAESQRLPATLRSLAGNPEGVLERFLILVVVNQREDAQRAEKEDNLRTLARLREGRPPLNLAWVDAASPGRELPSGRGGVGLARKIGMDLALPRLSRDGILACLDADTEVEGSYLEALSAHFAREAEGGAVLPFRHREGEDERQQRAIDLYELFLRHYVLGLSLAGSPYAFHTVGSAMACRASAYLKAGGMNSRSAAEDFYFLQQLQKTSGVRQLAGSTVFPSPRTSHRVPFGTGRSVTRILQEGEGWQTFYRPECFQVLKEWLLLVREEAGHEGGELLRRARGILPELAAHLQENRFVEVWDRLSRNASDRGALQRSFHGWFDALKTVRTVHRLCERFPRVPPGGALPALLAVGGVAAPRGERAQLELLRSIQNCPEGHNN